MREPNLVASFSSSSCFSTIAIFLSRRCGSCYANCETCTGPSESNCTTCKSGFFELSNKCYSSCPSGFYGDAKRRECVQCVPNCDVCSNGGACVTCSSGYVLNHESKCVTIGSQLCKTGTVILEIARFSLRSLTDILAIFFFRFLLSFLLIIHAFSLSLFSNAFI